MHKNNSDIYDELFNKYRPTMRSMVADIIYNLFITKNKTKKSIYKDDSNFRFRSEQPNELNIEYIAIVIDGIVKEAIRLDKNTASLLLSKYAILVPFDPYETGNIIGSKYINNEFLKDDDVKKD